ncbi:MAG: phosphatase PAP2 family protein [Chitinophagales bacterium]
MRRNLTKEEINFGLGTILYALICLGFAITFAKGMEVSYVTQHYSEILHSFFTYVTQVAELPGIILFILLVVLKDRKQLLHYTIIALLTALTITIFKHLIFSSSDRPRAWAIQQHIVLPADASNLLHFSFPSGHTAFAFCLMYCLVILYNEKKWTFFFLSIGILVGLSRIYLLAHFVIDTGIGALIGLSMGMIGNRLYNRYLSKLIN